MKNPLRIAAVAAVAAALVLLSPSTARSTSGDSFQAHLAGRNEVPPVDSKGTGQVTFKLSDDGTSLSYKMVIANIDEVTQAHIHIAPEGVNGPVVTFLYGFNAAGTGEPGILAEGTITAADLIPRPAIGYGGTMAELLAAMRAGNTYVNVHTHPFPGGEIRGQIK
jgi:hypothetical protein